MSSKQRAIRGTTRAFTSLITLALMACGGDHGPWKGDGGNTPGSGQPGAVQGLEANAGDGVVDLGWIAPANGTAPFSYNITIAPSSTQAVITQFGTTALVRGLSNGTAYTFSVSASNISGSGPAATVQSQPAAVSDGSTYSPITIQGDSSTNGVLDPAPLRPNTSGTTWMAYTGATFYNDSNGRPIRDFATRLARSDDGGQTFTFVLELGTPQAASINDSQGVVCAGAFCNGRWTYVEPWLVNDSGDPNPDRRFKLFAHKYFQFPPSSASQFPQLGAIVMWTASSPDGTWSQEQPVLGWSFTPQALAAPVNLNNLDPSLAQCLYAGSGSASIGQDGLLNFVFNCPYDQLTPPTRKVVLIRSADHTASFQYITTLLQPADAAALGAVHFSAPSLLPSPTSAPALIVTPVIADAQNSLQASGCWLIPLSDENTGTLYRETSNNAPINILALPAPPGAQGDGCGWDRGLNVTGLLMTSSVTASGPFSIVRTNRSP